MNILLILAYLFFIGSLVGWVMELFFRKFISRANPERKWINPGLCTGPYLPLYGTGLCVLYLLASLENLLTIENEIAGKVILFILMAVAMTALEFVVGLASLKLSNVRLWDYTDEWGNVMGIICPLFSLIWAALGGVYYFFIHPYIEEALAWLGRNLAFSFFIGLFFGVFIIDVAHSLQLLAKLKQFADEYRIILRYETIKAQIRSYNDQHAHRFDMKIKLRFFRPFASYKPINEILKELKENLEEKSQKLRKIDIKGGAKAEHESITEDDKK